MQNRSLGSIVYFAAWLCLPGLALAPLGLAYAESGDDSLRAYAVNILRHPREPWTGYGVYLGNGLVITAAHVAGPTFFTKPSVLIADLDLPAKVVKEGTLEEVDLTLLAIDEEKLPADLRTHRVHVCDSAPKVGESVIVAIPEGTARSHIMSPDLLPPNVRERFRTVISDVATTGNSGSGVFDAKSKCLLGIMSRKIQVRDQTNPQGELKDLAKYFVPAPTIRVFIPNKDRF